MVTRDVLYVNGEPVLSVAELGAAPDPVVEALRAALELRPQGVIAGSEARREVTVMAEKSLPYSVLRRSSRAVRRPSTPRFRSRWSSVN